MNEAAKQAIVQAIKSQLIKALIKEIPFFGFKLVYPLTSQFVSILLKIAFEKTELALYFYQVDLMTDKQARAVDEAQKALEVAKDDKEIELAEQNLKNSLRDLIKIKPK